MKVVCAWCNKEVREVQPFDDTDITHGICQECFDEVEAEFNHGKGVVR